MIALESSATKIDAPQKRRANKAEAENSESQLSDAEEEENDVESGEDADEVDSDGSGESGDAGSEDSASEDEKPKSSKTNNPGWADVMQKILKTNKPKKKKSIVLSKAKKLSEVKVKEPIENVPFEIENEDGVRKKEPKTEPSKETEETPVKRRKKETQLGIRVKPSVLDREREKMLQKIATKGVVQLFNVVKQQQTEIDKKLVEVGPLERKREQVMKSIDKRAFLDVLMGGSKSIPIDDPGNRKKVEKNEDEKTDKVWSVLRDDFVMGAKLKDWDKKAPEDENDSTSSEEMDSD